MLGNRYLTPQSVIFIAGPESALHPSAISEFLEIVDLLSKQGIQFFITTHSYFVVKKLYLLALKNKAMPDINCVEATETFRKVMNAERRMWNIKDNDIQVLNTNKARKLGLVSPSHI